MFTLVRVSFIINIFLPKTCSHGTRTLLHNNHIIEDSNCVNVPRKKKEKKEKKK